MGREHRSPLTGADVTEREPIAIARHPDDDVAEAGPRVEPAVEELELGLARLELGEAEGGAEGDAATLG
jgi:hypothetical protein